MYITSLGEAGNRWARICASSSPNGFRHRCIFCSETREYHVRIDTWAAINSFLDKPSELFDFQRFHFSLKLPISQRLTHNFTGARIISAIDGRSNIQNHLMWKRHTDLVNSCHSLPPTYLEY